MSISKLKKGKYRIYVSAGSDAHGKRLMRTQRFTGSFRDAQAREAVMRAEIRSGKYIVGDPITFRDYVETFWLPKKVMQLAPTTMQNYQMILRVHLLPGLGKTVLQRINSQDVTVITAGLVEAGKVRTAQNVHIIAHNIFEGAITDEIIGRNPLDRVKTPKPRPREMRTLTAAQASNVMDELKQQESWAYVPVVVFVTTGIRRSELAGLRWGDFDSDRNTLTIQRSYHVLRGGKPLIKSTKTRRSRRVVALDRHTSDLLRTHKETAIHRYKMHGEVLVSDDYIFSRADGTP